MTEERYVRGHTDSFSARPRAAAVIPVGNDSGDVLGAVLNGTLRHIWIRERMVVIDASDRGFPLGLLHPHEALFHQRMEDWLASSDQPQPGVLTTFVPSDRQGRERWTADLAGTVEAFRDDGLSALLIGPCYSPQEASVYNQIIRRTCDTVVVLGDMAGLETCSAGLSDLLQPPLARTLLTYGAPPRHNRWDTHHRHLPPVCVDEEPPFIAEIATAVGVLTVLEQHLPRS